MKIRALSLFVAILALCTALLLWLDQRPDPQPTDQRIGQPILSTDKAREIASLKITPADREPILLTNRGDGTWILPEYHQLPADFQKLSRLMRNLVDAEITRFVTRRPERAERLDLGHHTLELKNTRGDTLAVFSIGRRSQTGTGSYFQFVGDETVYLLNQTVSPDNEAGLWTQKTPLTLEEEAIRSLHFEFANGTRFHASRNDPDEAFLPDDIDSPGAFTPEPFETALNNLLTIRYNEVRPLEDPEVVEARTHATTVTISPFVSESLTVAYGRRPEKEVPTPDAESEENEEEPETIPAGPAYLFLEFPGGSTSPWAEPGRTHAFKIAEFYFTRLPQNPDSWLE